MEFSELFIWVILVIIPIFIAMLFLCNVVYIVPVRCIVIIYDRRFVNQYIFKTINLENKQHLKP